MLRIADCQSELGRQDRLALQVAAGEGTAPVVQAQLRGRDPSLAVAVGDDDGGEHIGQAASVGASVVDHGAADGAGDAGGPLQAGPALVRQIASQPGETRTRFGAKGSLISGTG